MEDNFINIINDILKQRAKDKPLSPEMPSYRAALLQIFLFLRQATSHPYLLEAAFKKYIKAPYLQNIRRGLKKIKSEVPFYKQIRQSDGKDYGDEFGISDFGYDFDMSEELKIAEAAKSATDGTMNICNSCLALLEDCQAMLPQVSTVYEVRSGFQSNMSQCKHVLCMAWHVMARSQSALACLNNPIQDAPNAPSRSQEATSSKYPAAATRKG